MRRATDLAYILCPISCNLSRKKSTHITAIKWFLSFANRLQRLTKETLPSDAGCSALVWQPVTSAVTSGYYGSSTSKKVVIRIEFFKGLDLEADRAYYTI